MREACFREDGNPTTLRDVLRDELRPQHRNAQTLGDSQEAQLDHRPDPSFFVTRGNHKVTTKVNGQANLKCQISH